jgi:hypothetical protein
MHALPGYVFAFSVQHVLLSFIPGFYAGGPVVGRSSVVASQHHPHWQTLDCVIAGRES